MRAGRLLTAMFWLSILLAATAAAQNPFSGTWKLNQEKSQLAGDTLKFRPADQQSIELTAEGLTYSFRMDGKTYAVPSGNIAVWREISPTSWSTENRTAEGKLLSNDELKLSADGKTLSVTTTGAKADGDLYTDTAQYARTAGTAGLIGEWKSTSVSLSSPDEFSIETLGFDGLVLKVPAMQLSCQARFDGKEVPVEGPDLPAGLRLIFERTGPYTFRLTQKLNGTPVRSSIYTVSEDRETMTEVGGATGDPPSTMVWEKQAPPPAPPARAPRPVPPPPKG
jgi:hypothetical protein